MKSFLPPLKLPFAYCDTPELRVLDLSADGVPCIPVLGLTRLGKGGRPTTGEEHVHDECIEISYCKRGALVFESGGREYPLRPGDVFVSRPNEPHRLKMFPKGLLMYWMFFRFTKDSFPLLLLPKNEGRWLKATVRDLPHRMFAGGDRVGHAFQRLFAVYDHEPRRTPQRALRIRAAVVDLLLSVVDASSIGEIPASDKRVEQVIADIRADPVKAFSIDELASRTALSPSNLILRFKRLTGLPPQAFRNACRIERAKDELRNGPRTITALAIALGYSSAQNFATQFRLATGKTPRAWRNDA